MQSDTAKVEFLTALGELFGVMARDAGLAGDETERERLLERGEGFLDRAAAALDDGELDELLREAARLDAELARMQESQS